MPRKQLRWGQGFSVALGNRRAQAATMVLKPGDSEGGPDNRHRGSDQWLYVVSGTLLLIERRITHEIRNTGKRRSRP
jgi:uncharacterized cupin superfamily protein